MMTDALLAYLHFSAIFLLFAFLTVEAMVLRNPLDANAVRLIARIDLWYVAAVLLALASGLMRFLWGAKGAEFYSGNPMFYVKVALFVAVGVLSVWPALQFRRWSALLAADAAFVAPEAERALARRQVMFELHIAALLPLFAVLMARGISFN